MMVEVGATELSEEIVLDGILVGHEKLKLWNFKTSRQKVGVES